MNWIVIVGNLDDGFKFYGPFSGQTTAIEWADKWQYDNEWSIARLRKTDRRKR